MAREGHETLCLLSSTVVILEELAMGNALEKDTSQALTC